MEDFRKDDRRYDFIFDAVGKSTFNQCKHLLKKKGIYTSSEPNLIQALITPIVGGKREIFAIPRNLMDNLRSIKSLVEQGNFVPVIDRHYPLEGIREAYAYVASGEKIGNVIIDMMHDLYMR